MGKGLCVASPDANDRTMDIGSAILDESGKRVAKGDAGQFCFHFAGATTYIAGSLHFRIKCFDLRRTALEKEHDDRFVPHETARFGLRLRRHHALQRRSTEPHAADAEKLPPSKFPTVSNRCVIEYRNHQLNFCHTPAAFLTDVS